jgi:hypothetical protein
MMTYRDGQYINMAQEEIDEMNNQVPQAIEPTEVEQLKQQVTDLQLAIVEIYEGGLL